VTLRIIHLSDLHFGGKADLAQIEALERLVPELAPAAVVVSGDLSQRSRHGEFQRALAFVQGCQRAAPTLVVPGNHDVR
jgi:3',5'-cyclic AMP phosphodiesterase CpdA